jgi:pilus assembly protein Flp/PilA
MSNFLARFVIDETGVTALEYGLIAALIVIVIIAAVTRLGPALIPAFQTIATALTGA